MTANEDSSAEDNSVLRNLCLETRRQVDAFLEEDTKDSVLRDVQSRTRASLTVIDEALRRYPLHSLSLSYNGGKDCLVLLVLYLAALANHASPLPEALQSIYIVSKDPFPEVEAFTLETSRKYQLALLRVEEDNMREAFAKYLSSHGSGSNVKAFLVGTRRTDPHGGSLTEFSPTDGKWPAFMRVNAVLDWKYREIWAFIRYLQIPYCELYDLGYTSLGGTCDTHPNPALVVPNKEAGGRMAKDGRWYRPAYELWEDDEERLGRDWKS